MEQKRCYSFQQHEKDYLSEFKKAESFPYQLSKLPENSLDEIGTYINELTL
jgi:hypothetical protein